MYWMKQSISKQKLQPIAPEALPSIKVRQIHMALKTRISHSISLKLTLAVIL